MATRPAAAQPPVLKSRPVAAPAPVQKIQIKRPPVLFKETQAILAKLEALTKQTFLTYWNSPGGSICHNDVVAFNEICRQIGRQKGMMLFIKSNGGTGRASLRIVHLLRHFTPRLIAAVPLNCESAATMLSLGADEIHMGPLAFLTAVDTSITHDLSPIDKDNDRVSVSQDELCRIVNAWRKEARKDGSNPYQSLFNHVHPLVIGAVDRASSLSIKLCEEILSYHMSNKSKAAKISRHLNSSYPSHSYPITIREAQRVGLNVKPLDPAVNDLLTELNVIYSEMGQKSVTDFDEENHHDNEILNIIEGRGIQILYQVDKDWHYRKEERRWVSLNDQSSWRKIVADGDGFKSSVLHIR
ncbi:MAG TPA: hypothetical protein VEK08_21910 [Planctomycetota bacterium]|nr:hypothetical protein [Planctomycetota bacterium]